MSKITVDDHSHSSQIVGIWHNEPKYNKVHLPTNLDEELRKLIGCACYYCETYDGKAWDNRKQEYVECECVEKISKLKDLVQSICLSVKQELVRDILEDCFDGDYLPYDVGELSTYLLNILEPQSLKEKIDL